MESSAAACLDSDMLGRCFFNFLTAFLQISKVSNSPRISHNSIPALKVITIKDCKPACIAPMFSLEGQSRNRVPSRISFPFSSIFECSNFSNPTIYSRCWFK